jgi:sigma-B regulation protein RsbU (phosphoserine phosphatase)
MRMQRFLLPPARIEGDGWRIEHLYRPAERLGGDFIDVHRRPDGRIMMLVADVSGHGTSASLSTAMTKTVFLHAAPRVSSPAALLGAIHRELIDMTPPGQFITALAALFDPATKQIELASAGHPRPLRIGDGSVEVIDTQNDLILLAVPETVYERVHRVTLRPGERLLIYTDGATEAADDQGRMLETRGLSRLVGEAGQGNGDAFLATLFDRINDHAGHRLFDDVALLSIRVE